MTVHCSAGRQKALHAHTHTHAHTYTHTNTHTHAHTQRQLADTREELDFSNQLFHDVSVHCNAIKREVNHAKDVLVSESMSENKQTRIHIHTCVCALCKCACFSAYAWAAADRVHASWPSMRSCKAHNNTHMRTHTITHTRTHAHTHTRQINVGAVSFPDVLPTYTFCEATPEEVRETERERESERRRNAATTKQKSNKPTNHQ